MSEVQSVIFDKHVWNILGAHQWLIHNHFYPIKSPHETEHFYRFRLKNPKKFRRYITKNLGNGVELIIGFK
jgi:hypothetical protein